ncbi:hypothetical protein KUTeg_013722 [Tegillarca granosa]|uniref:Beta-N-acetylhexosaminidase n=1 Tax=Tegillarca granosa TaxID=220873 RepID=A0ABQ9EZW6_TEGGR|nr:hypothetical protein KUTeg_013722 [Tegillarca granosa]
MIVDIYTTLSDVSVPHVLCHVNTRLCPGRGLYKLTITHNQIKAICSDKESVFSAIATIYQLLKLYREEDQISIPILLVDDWPDLYYRGVLLDLSQGRLPVLDSLKHTVDTLSLLKINLIHLFYRFSVAKTQEWQLPYTKSDIMDLEEYCLERGIQLVPVIEVAPPVQYEDIDDLYNVFQDFVSCFPDAEFLSLGPRLSSFMLSNEDDVLDVTDAVKLLPVLSNHTLQLCGYPLHDLDSTLLQQLPPNIVINEYGIKADHDFKRFCRPLCDQGISFCICPGTAAWNSIAGCPEAAINNIYHAVKGGVSQGAIGVICCNWSGKGHLTHQPFSWTGYLVSAGLGWNSNCRPDYLFGNVGILLNEHVFQDKSVVGHAIVIDGTKMLTWNFFGEKGNEANAHSIPDEHGSTLFQFFGNPDSVNLSFYGTNCMQRTSKHIKRCQQELEKTEMKCKQSNQIVSELHLSCDLMLYALRYVWIKFAINVSEEVHVQCVRICRSLMLSGKNPSGLAGFSTINLGIANLPATVKTDLANRLLEMLEQYKLVWCERYVQVTGIQDSLHIFTSLLKHLLPNQETEELIHPQH